VLHQHHNFVHANPADEGVLLQVLFICGQALLGELVVQMLEDGAQLSPVGHTFGFELVDEHGGHH
jgi:hypothetical protein